MTREQEIQERPPFEVMYRNWRGETRLRKLEPINVRFGATEWHPEPQWLMLARDLETDEHKEFALKDMSPVADDITYLLARVKQLEEQLAKAGPQGKEVW